MFRCHISLPEWNWKSPCALLSTLFETLSHLLKINPFPFIHQLSLSALSLSPFFVNVHPQHVLQTFFFATSNPSKSIQVHLLCFHHHFALLLFRTEVGSSSTSPFRQSTVGRLLHHDRRPHTTTCLQWWKLLPRPEVSSFAFGKSGKWGMQIGDKLG